MQVGDKKEYRGPTTTKTLPNVSSTFLIFLAINFGRVFFGRALFWGTFFMRIYIYEYTLYGSITNVFIAGQYLPFFVALSKPVWIYPAFSMLVDKNKNQPRTNAKLALKHRW
eukprot:GEMP01048582.1.p1 GENE.GEMP01048582.1~~GEMP01048582.1.p1  ORF type:complete len:112 (+),score=0.19 GEMP01048582.1:809-1144(+)